ncbi:hypothetical protein [Micromonospora sp. LOL_021]|uniref:hypothetical protein n=1 Tax=Micromonospora sp. LOL_021 TaxID=3345417 RepID=UPI003A869847
MTAETSATREILLVVGVAMLGVLLALVSVVTPWYTGPTAGTGPVVVELHAPDPPVRSTDIEAAPR